MNQDCHMLGAINLFEDGESECPSTHQFGIRSNTSAYWAAPYKRSFVTLAYVVQVRAIDAKIAVYILVPAKGTGYATINSKTPV